MNNSTTDNQYPHTSVLLEEALQIFADKKIKVFFEGTVGAGGHAEAFLKAHDEIEHYIGCDQDETALEIAKERLMPWKDKVTLIHGNFSQLESYLRERGIQQVDGFFLT